MKRKILATLLCLISISSMAQTDSTLFKGKITNKEYDVYMNIDFYHKNLKVPGQELFGEMPGYFGDRRDSRKWLITDADIEGKTAHLSIINDYGSEDLTADLIALPDGSYELQQKEGSNLKIARNRKWVKIPKKLKFTKQCRQSTQNIAEMPLAIMVNSEGLLYNIARVIILYSKGNYTK